MQTGNIRQRKQAIAALALIGDNRDVATLSDCLDDQEQCIAILAAKFLKKYPATLTGSLLSNVHKNKNSKLILEAAESQLAVNQSLTMESLDALCQILNTTTNDAYRASRILGQCKHASTAEAMAQAIEFWASQRGYEGLNPIDTIAVDLGLHGEVALPAIKRLSNHSDRNVRRHAIRSLSLLKTEEATRLLMNAAKDKDEHVREAAKQQLKGRHKPGLFGFGKF